MATRTHDGLPLEDIDFDRQKHSGIPGNESGLEVTFSKWLGTVEASVYLTGIARIHPFGKTQIKIFFDPIKLAEDKILNNLPPPEVDLS